VGVIGIGLAPWLIGVLSDEFTLGYGRDGLRMALQVSLVLSVVTALLYLQMARVLRTSAPLTAVPAAVTAR
jgi:hypothetical protein